MPEGLPLAAQIAGTGRPLAILHGLFGSGRNWGGIARRLPHVQAHLLDARNHGASPWAPSMTYPEMAMDLAAYIESHGLAPVDVLGHSMGGKIAMTLALTRPALIDRLILVDIAPVTYGAEGAHEAYPDYISAMRGLDVAHMKRRAEADAALAATIHDATLRAFLVQGLESVGEGYRWRINLDAIEAGLDDLTAFPDFQTRFERPTLFVSGELSNYIRPRDEAAIKRHFPNAAIEEVGGSGHWPHADQPERLVGLIEHALRR